MMGERLPDSESAKSERLTHDGVRSLGPGSHSRPLTVWAQVREVSN